MKFVILWCYFAMDFHLFQKKIEEERSSLYFQYFGNLGDCRLVMYSGKNFMHLKLRKLNAWKCTLNNEVLHIFSVLTILGIACHFGDKYI